MARPPGAENDGAGNRSKSTRRSRPKATRPPAAIADHRHHWRRPRPYPGNEEPRHHKVGHGIAVSFVATVYGVGLANIFLLPAANKMKARVQQDSHMREMMLEGVIGIVEGLNPKLIRIKLEAFAPPRKENKAKPDVPAAEPEAAE
jgi:hypothetical protein